MIKTGIYRHFKGGVYQVICCGVEPDSAEKFVVYYPVSRYSQINIRTVENFTEHVIRDSYAGPRFVLVQESQVTIKFESETRIECNER